MVFMVTANTDADQRFIVDPNADPTSVVTAALSAIDYVVSELPPKVALQLLEFSRRRIDATEARVLADRFEAGASDRDVEDMIRTENNTSKAEAQRRAKLAKATNANPALADRMDEGSLSTEQADVIAAAAADTDGAAACDTELIDDVAGTTPEQAKKKAREYVNERKSGAEIQKEHDLQHINRSVYRFRTSDGGHAIALKADEATIDRMERKFNRGADIEYQLDGGRDVPRHEHPRTNDQRRFDAAAKIIFGEDTDIAPSSAEISEPASESPSETAQPTVSTTVPEPDSHLDPQPASDPKPKSNPKPKPRDERRTAATIIVTTVVDLKDPANAVFTTADGKTLPRSVVEDLMWGADWIGQVFSAEGELLWQGRRVRYATAAQITGLIARDGGCVLCLAHYDRCEAHHCDPWEAPMQGETNIDRLALLCKPCHIDLHKRKRTLYYDRKSRSWKTRPATWQEIPPDAPKNRKHPEPESRTKPYLHEKRRNALRNDPHGIRLPLIE